jgi:hypothetical protein
MRKAQKDTTKRERQHVSPIDFVHWHDALNA